MNHHPSRIIIDRVDSFPALPATVSRVMQITANPESSAQELMQAILPDQSMCVTILKIANSAFFGLPRQVSSIDKAVMVLGFDEIRNIVIGKAVFNSFQDISRGNRGVIESFWRHAFTCGLAAKIIAGELQLSQSEAFTAGLIHDIGKLAMLISLNGDYHQLLELSGTLALRSYIREQEQFGISHDEIGFRLLNRWLFPQALLDAIRYHHHPQESSRDQLLPAIIQVADILAHNHCGEDNIAAADLKDFFDDFAPEISAIWQRQRLDWSSATLVNWQQELALSSERDDAIFSFITGT